MALPGESFPTSGDVKEWNGITIDKFTRLKNLIEQGLHDEAAGEIKSMLSEIKSQKLAEVVIQPSTDDSQRDLWRSGIDWMGPIDFVIMLERLSSKKHVSIIDAIKVLENCEKFFEIAGKLAKGGTTFDTAIQLVSGKDFPDILATVLSGAIIKKIQDTSKNEIIKAEVKAFLMDNLFNNTQNREKVIDIFNSKILIEFVRDTEIVMIYLNKLSLSGSDAEKRGIKKVDIDTASRSIFSMYFNEKTAPVLRIFVDGYFSGKLGETRKAIEGSSEIAKKVAPPYHRLFMDKKVLDSFFNIFGQPEKIRNFFQNTHSKLKALEGIIQASQAPEDIRRKPLFMKRRPGDTRPTWPFTANGKIKFTRKGNRDDWKAHVLFNGFRDIMKEFLEIFGPTLAAIKEFVKQNPDAWRYFKQNGVRLQEKTEGEKNNGFLNPDTVLKIFMGRGIFLDIGDITSDDIIQNILMDEEALSLLITGLVLQMYSLRSKADNSRTLRNLLSSEGVRFGPWRFRNALRFAINGEKKSELQEKFEILIELTHLLSQSDVEQRQILKVLEKFKK